MKAPLLILLTLLAVTLRAQSEFAARGFYEDVRQCWADARQDFVSRRGERIDSTDLQTVYRPRTLLAQADSGLLVYPRDGQAYAEFFFEPSKSRLKTDQRASDLRDALYTALGRPLYLRSETFLVDQEPYTHTWIFTDPGETLPSKAAFRISVYYSDGRYCLSLIVRGSMQD